MPRNTSPASQPRSSRADALDALRGLAMVWMTAYHFAFDLNHFGHIRQDFYADPFWTWQRTAILSLFLLCAGMGQAVAHQQGQTWARFWQRWWRIAACALLVTIGSYFMFPRSFIYVGVLHGMALMLVLARATAGWGGWLWLAGVVALLLHQFLPGWLVSVGLGEIFHTRWLNWLGLVVQKPVTEDYVPLLPWMAVLWWGLALGGWLHRRAPGWWRWQAPAGPARVLPWLGRWSLGYYMVHQPVLIGALTAWGLLRG